MGRGGIWAIPFFSLPPPSLEGLDTFLSRPSTHSRQQAACRWVLGAPRGCVYLKAWAWAGQLAAESARESALCITSPQYDLCVATKVEDDRGSDQEKAPNDVYHPATEQVRNYFHLQLGGGDVCCDYSGHD